MDDPGKAPLLGTIDEYLAWLHKFRSKKKWDKQHTYVIDIIKVLHGRKFYITKAALDDSVLEKRRADGEPIPPSFIATTQNILNNYTSQSEVFRKAGKGPEDDLFYSPQGKGSGTWALHQERAQQWLKRKVGETQI